MIRIAAHVLAAGLGMTQLVHAQSPPAQSPPAPSPSTQASSAQASSVGGAFELVDGDRVVLLGSGFVEAAQEYGYVELALSTRWPDREVTFRNVGWSGDTVFGEARLHYTNPPGPYQRLLDEAAAPRPTVLFVGYGADVPFEQGDADESRAPGRSEEGHAPGHGEEGHAIARFEEGLVRLIGDLEAETGARIILLSPPPHEADVSPAPAEFVRRINGTLKQVSDVVERVAGERGHLFVDVFGGLDDVERSLEVPITRDGVELNAAGYFHLARIIEEGLGLEPRGWVLRVDVPSGEVEAVGARVSDVHVENDVAVTLSVEPDLVSVPPPQTLPPEAVPAFYARHLTATGLPEGGYALTFEGQRTAATTSHAWAEGVAVAPGTIDARAERLRRLIVEKNRLYIHRYRPPNETYIVGFRSYEQGQHAEDLGRYGPLIEEKEREIGRLKDPAPLMLKLGPAAGP